MFRSWSSGPDVSPTEDRRPAGQPARPAIDGCRPLGPRSGPSPFPGRSLARCWAPGPAQPSSDDEFLLTETSDELSRTPTSSTRARSLLHHDKVYIRNKDGSEELYDQSTDPAETRNLAHSTEAAQWLGLFRNKMNEIDQAATIAEDRRREKHRRGTSATASLETASCPGDLTASASCH